MGRNQRPFLRASAEESGESRGVGLDSSEEAPEGAVELLGNQPAEIELTVERI